MDSLRMTPGPEAGEDADHRERPHLSLNLATVAKERADLSNRDPIIPNDPFPVLAVDVSLSTSGGVLKEEIRTIKELSRNWLSQARGLARVIPWSGQVHQAIELNQLDQLLNSRGTRPSLLAKVQQSISLLEACSIWYLLTDGKITENEVYRFTSNLIERGLHGTGCVVILFGERPSSPIRCNVSVGQAVFGSVPHCAFLFHDVNTSSTHVLQCKGCFRGLLPRRDAEIVLNDATIWDSLPRTSYDKVANISVPPGELVRAGNILLGNGEQISLDDLYNDRLAKSITDKILESDDDLKTLLLTARNLGRNSDIEQWLNLQMSSRDASYLKDRPDIGQAASKLVRELVNAMLNEPRDLFQEKALKKKLRVAHFNNWGAFNASLDASKSHEDRLEEVVKDALARVRSPDVRCGSPAMMSPVSPGLVSDFERLSPYGNLGDQERQVPNIVRPRRQRGLATTAALADQLVSGSYRPRPFPQDSKNATLLHLKGYSCGTNHTKVEPYRGSCAICAGVTSPLALLLKPKPADHETEGGFPVPGSRQTILYPLAMGSFPETDILSSFICCERCAEYIHRLGYSPLDEKVVGVVPLVPLSVGINRKLMIEQIDIALAQRFDVSIVDQIFLSILYLKLDDIVGEHSTETEQLKAALIWESRNFTDHITLPETLASEDPDPQHSTASLADNVDKSIRGETSEERFRLLRYPLDGFITLMKCHSEANPDPIHLDRIEEVVFQRFIFHLAEQQQLLIENGDLDIARRGLLDLINSRLGGFTAGHFRASVEALTGTYLLDIDDLEKFQRLQQPFQSVESKCAAAIMLLLMLMAHLWWEDQSAEKFHDFALKAVKDPMCFTSPWNLTEEQAREFSEVAISRQIDAARA